MTTQKAASSQNAISTLTQRYPWPEECPDVMKRNWSLDGGGRWMVQEKLRREGINLLLEIGSFLGGSILNWLEASPDVIVAAVDPWPDSAGVADYARKLGLGESFAKQLEQPQGFYNTFVANMWEYRDRVIPVREYSPGILHELADLGLCPDLIYLDSDKVGTEIELCAELFPGAIMTGDDWEWKGDAGQSDGDSEDEMYPIRGPVRNFCARNHRYLKVEGATWVIDTEPPSLRFRLRTWRRELRRRRKARAA